MYTATMRALRGLRRQLLGIAGVLLLCSSVVHAWPWSKDMAEQPSIKPQEAPRLPPVNSIPTQGTRPKMDRVTAGKKLKNPIKPTTVSIDNGKTLSVRAQKVVLAGGAMPSPLLLDIGT